MTPSAMDNIGNFEDTSSSKDTSTSKGSRGSALFGGFGSARKVENASAKSSKDSAGGFPPAVGSDGYAQGFEDIEAGTTPATTTAPKKKKKKKQQSPAPPVSGARYDSKQQEARRTCCCILFGILLLLVGIGGGIGIGIGVFGDDSDDEPIDPPLVAPTLPSSPTVTPPTPSAPVVESVPTPSPTALEPTKAPTIIGGLRELIIPISLEPAEDFDNPESSSYRAIQWLSENRNLEFYDDAKRIVRYALAVFYFSTDGPNWRDNSNWLSDLDECTWYAGGFPSCNSDRVFANLVLGANNLKGRLPRELALLAPSMSRINLHGLDGASLSGPIPPEYGLFADLKEFSVRRNSLTGTIPTDIQAWRSLTDLDLNGNDFAGQLPTIVLNALSNLEVLDAGDNRLTGTLPPQISSLISLTDLNLEQNQLGGSIPTSLGRLSNLVNLNLDDNAFTAIPREIGQVTTLETLSIRNNQVGGTMHTEFGLLRSLNGLFLDGNQLGFRIPTELGRITSMRDGIDLSNNELIGSVPSELGRLSNMSK